MAKRKITARELLADLRANMIDSELMGKYMLSAAGLQSVFNKLVKAGLITQAELDARVSTADRTVDLGFVCPSCGYLRNEEFDQCPRCGFATPTYIKRERDKERRKKEPPPAAKVSAPAAKREGTAPTIALPSEPAVPPQRSEEVPAAAPDLSGMVKRSRVLVFASIAAYAVALVMICVMLLILPSSGTITVGRSLVAMLILQVPILVVVIASFVNLRMLTDAAELMGRASRALSERRAP